MTVIALDAVSLNRYSWLAPYQTVAWSIDKLGRWFLSSYIFSSYIRGGLGRFYFVLALSSQVLSKQMINVVTWNLYYIGTIYIM